MCWVWCVSHFLTPPSIFIGGSHGQGKPILQLCLGEPTSTSNDKPPRGRVEAVGPMGWSADQGGRPATQWAQPTSAFLGWVVFWTHMSLALVLAYGMSVSLVGPLIHVLTCVAF